MTFSSHHASGGGHRVHTCCEPLTEPMCVRAAHQSGLAKEEQRIGARSQAVRCSRHSLACEMARSALCGREDDGKNNFYHSHYTPLSPPFRRTKVHHISAHTSARGFYLHPHRGSRSRGSHTRVSTASCYAHTSPATEAPSTAAARQHCSSCASVSG